MAKLGKYYSLIDQNFFVCSPVQTKFQIPVLSMSAQFAACLVTGSFTWFLSPDSFWMEGTSWEKTAALQ